jgi:hypothetical protein
MFLFEVEGYIVDNFVYFYLVFALSQTPEHFQNILIEHVLSQQQLQDVSAPLNYL